ncbi:MAG: hypothetical protein KA717_20095 [Woronichinia naegeliana WA131]|uniref:Uncharacterized protein n=1 Tax=Woronichinia naegeliana WA131 TaxID=2824559 RepID=A0A977KT77_9CYAN|nr:MAG: hypothetical protein KA717_20095 [Woronichinia naegeliana WA131]
MYLIIHLLPQSQKNLKEKRKEKPRTYREVARKEYLAIAKKRRVSKKERRKGGSISPLQ